MSDLLNALKESLEHAKQQGNTEWQAALETRIADLEKPPEPAAKPAAKTTPKKGSK